MLYTYMLWTSSSGLLHQSLRRVHRWIEPDSLARTCPRPSTGPAALDAMARARVATMRLRKQRQTELLALAGCHGRAATLLEAKPEAPAAETLQVCSVLVCPSSICSESLVKKIRCKAAERHHRLERVF